MARRRFGRDGAEFGRGLGFFDAIHAFAITLLVVNIEPPPAASWSSLSSLLGSGLGTALMGFAISFVVIAVFWRSHTEMMSRFNGIDQTVITVSLLSAGLVVLVPFTTQGISDNEIADYPLPVALYATNVAAVILTHAITLEVGRARGLLVAEPSRELLLVERLDALVKIVVFMVSIPVAYLVSPGWGMLTWLLLIPIGIAFGQWGARIERRTAECSPAAEHSDSAAARPGRAEAVPDPDGTGGVDLSR